MKIENLSLDIRAEACRFALQELRIKFPHKRNSELITLADELVDINPRYIGLAKAKQRSIQLTEQGKPTKGALK